MLDVYEKYPSASMVIEKDEKRFVKDVTKMAIKKGHRKGIQLANATYQLALTCLTSEPSLTTLSLSVKQCVAILRCTEEAIKAIITQMDELAQTLPEYDVVRNMSGVGEILTSRLIAEV